jgi:hypothetical protein
MDRCLLIAPVCVRLTLGWVDQGFTAGAAAVQKAKRLP